MGLRHLSTGILATLLVSRLLCLRFEGCLLQSACFSSFQRCPMGFRSQPMEGHFRIVQCFCSQPFLGVSSCVFWGHYVHDLPLRLSWAAHFAPEGLDSREVSLYPAEIQDTCARCSKAAPEHSDPPPCFTVGTVLFSLYAPYTREAYVTCQKAFSSVR